MRTASSDAKAAQRGSANERCQLKCKFHAAFRMSILASLLDSSQGTTIRARQEFYESGDCSGPVLEMGDFQEVDVATGCTPVPGYPQFTMIQDCGGDGTPSDPGPVHHTYFNTGCAGSPTYSQQFVGMPDPSPCESANVAQCSAYMRSLDCGGCTTPVSYTHLTLPTI